MDNAYIKSQPQHGFYQPGAEREVPLRKDIAPYVATNKGGVPVTRLRAVITLHDRLPAFTIKTIKPYITKHIVSGIGGLGHALVPVQSKGGREFVSLPSTGVRGNGGVLFLPRPGTNTVRLFAWNVERLSLSRNCSNQSHAETQFLNWFNGHAKRYPGFVSRVKRIHLYINKSPCGGCTEDLCSFVRKHGLGGKVHITWAKTYTKGTCGIMDVQKMKQCGIQVLSDQELQSENGPRLRNIKVEKQQAHTYMLDKRVHSPKPQAVNRRLERLFKSPAGKPASLLSRVFASPHNRARVKRLFQRAIDQGNFTKRVGGGYEAVIPFKHTTGWSYGRPVKRLKMILDKKGSWHYYPVP
ncbi:hypothetical protein GCM10023188_27860 [Pontibacter saemangeumensis]|uniref:Activation-induced cytidine deaminase AID domain-containing protein n=1 Tax=Pontibacter saemangeumensis TaxID=1084525 RepID=A0ABP8LTW2_9BACT